MTSHGQHLTESEFVDLFDGTLAPVRRQHVESCAACAAQAADLAMSAQGVEQADVPEPPPFFWTQFSARVSEAVSNEAARPRIGAVAVVGLCRGGRHRRRCPGRRLAAELAGRRIGCRTCCRDADGRGGRRRRRPGR